MKTNYSDLTTAYMSGQDDMEKKMLARTCDSCKYDGCGCSVQDTIYRCDEFDGRPISDLDDFGCNKWSNNDN